jgi:hypothetical protein
MGQRRMLRRDDVAGCSTAGYHIIQSQFFKLLHSYPLLQRVRAKGISLLLLILSLIPQVSAHDEIIIKVGEDVGLLFELKLPVYP